MEKKLIYVAGPFFTKEERNQLNQMIDKIKKVVSKVIEEHPEMDVELYIPMEHFIEGGEEMPNHEWAYEVFKMDMTALINSDMVIAMYLGHYSDTGTSFELGVAYASGKHVSLYIPKEYRDKEMSLMPINGVDTITIFEEDEPFNFEDIIQK